MLKYIRYEKEGFIVWLRKSGDEGIFHTRMAKIAHDSVLSAGFVRFNDGLPECFGHSESLKQGSLGDDDTEALRKEWGFQEKDDNLARVNVTRIVEDFKHRVAAGADPKDLSLVMSCAPEGVEEKPKDRPNFASMTKEEALTYCYKHEHAFKADCHANNDDGERSFSCLITILEGDTIKPKDLPDYGMNY